MPLDYRSVKKQYDLLYGAGVTRKPLQEWSAEMNEVTGSDLYDRGKNAGWWTQASNWLDEEIFHPIASVTTAPIGEAIGDLFGVGEVGRMLGESLPRTLLETAPLYLVPGAGPIATAAKLASVGGLMAAHTYADTGSPQAAAISGVTGAALPLAGKYGGILGARAFGTAERVAAGDFATETGTKFAATQWLPKEGAQRVFKGATFTGSQTAQAVLQEASMYATSKALNEPFDPFSADFLIGQIPFTVVDAVNIGRAKIPTAKTLEGMRVPEKAPRPDYVPPPSSIEDQATLEKVFQNLEEVTLREDATPQEREVALATAIGVARDPKAANVAKKRVVVGEEPAVNVTGWGKKVGNAWKIVVDPTRTDQSIPFEEHGNVWINNQDPTVNPDGSVTFNTPFSKVNKKVTSPLKIEEVRRDPAQPDLPVQKNGLDPDETRIFEKVGVKIEEPDTLFSDETLTERAARLKPIAQELEVLQERGESAREKITLVPKTAEEVAQNVFDIPTVDSISRATQLVGEPKLRELAAKELVGLEGMDPIDARTYALEVSSRNVLEEHQKTRIQNDVSSGLSPTQAVESARLATHTPTIDAALEETNVLKRSAEKVQSEWKGKPQAEYGEAVRDEDGKNFATKELADAFREVDPELQDFVVRNAGKGKGYYLARQINKEVSLEGTNLEAVLDEQSTLVPPIDARPDVSIDDALGTIERMGKRVDVADEILGNDDLGQTLQELKFTREFIQKTRAGETVKLDPEMQKVVRKVTLATGEWNRQFRNWSIDSVVPHDPIVVQKMGIETGGLRAGLDWFTSHPQSGPMGSFIKGMLDAGDTNGITLADVDFIRDPRKGWSYDPEGRNGKPEITYPKLPSSENDAFSWSLNGAHEVAHHFGAGILTRNDPQAVQFRATLNKVNLALEQSALVPAKVRAAAKRARTEGWYEEFRNRNVPPEELHARFVKLVGEENKKWFNTFYAMQNEHELFAVMFNDHDLVDVLRKTKMPKSATETVLQFFSKAWNRLFNGAKPETDNALHEILTKFEGYLSGPKIAQKSLMVKPELTAGEGFLFGLAPFDPTSNTLGVKHALPKNGMEREEVFRNIGGVGKPLQQAEVDLYKSLVPEAFTESFVNVPKLVKGLKTKGPVVEVKKLGSGGTYGNQLAQAQHELDTLGYSVKDNEDGFMSLHDKTGKDVSDTAPQNVIDVFNRYAEAQRSVDSGFHSGYASIAPKPESEMPGYVEGLVRIPQGKAEPGQKFGAADPTDFGKATPKYVGPHFGSEDKNVLAFFRGYEETLPDGTKAFHVIEVQSDWGQQRRTFEQQGGSPPEARVASHPLLKVYETLALKAAIAHAKEVGATKVMVSDAATASMTEGHDRAAKLTEEKSFGFDGRDETKAQDAASAFAKEKGVTPIQDQHGNWSVVYPIEKPVTSQWKGMEEHYDRSIPSAMEKLTGQRGERVEVGVHKSAWSQIPAETTAGNINDALVGSPIFRDATGAPKTQITGRVYNISKVSKDQSLFDTALRSVEQKNPNVYNGRDYLRDALVAKGVRPEGLTSRVETLERLFAIGDLKVSLEGFVREAENDLLPATAELPKKPLESAFFDQKPTDLYHSIKGLLVEDVPAYQELWARMRQDVTTARELLENIEKGYVPGSIPPGAKEKLGEALVMTNAMKRGLDKQRLAIERWGDLQNFTPEGVEDTIASQLTSKRLPAPSDPTSNADLAQELLGLAEIRRETAHAELHGKEVSPGLITRNLMLTQHVKKLFPAFRPIANKVREAFGVQHEDNRALTLAYTFGSDVGRPSKRVAKNNARVASNESLKKAASNLRRWANIIEAKGESWSFDHPEVKQILSKFSDKKSRGQDYSDQEALKLENNSGRARHHAYTEVIVPKHLTNLNKANTAKIIAAYEVGMVPEQAREVATGIYDALATLQDPTTAVTGNEMLRELATKVQPQTFLAALKYSQEMIQVANEYLTKMRSRPSYSTEQRFDKFHLVMQGPDGQDFRASRDTAEEIRKIEADKVVQGYKFLDFIPKSDANVPSSIRQDVLDSMRELDVQRFNRLEAALSNVAPEIRAQILPETLRTQQYEASATAFKPLPTIHRRFVEGREYIDMLQNENEFYSRATNYWRHRITEAETSLDMMHHDIMGNRALKEFAAQHVENSLTPDNPFFRKLVKAVYFQRLAFSFGNSLLESTQHLGTGMQSLISETGSITDAFSLWGQAVKAVTQRGKKILSTGTKSDEMQWLRKRAEEAGIIRVSTFRDVHDPDSEAIGYAHRLSKNPLAKAAIGLEVGATKWATFFQRFNDEVGLYAGYKLGREKGMSQEEAFNFAWDVKERGTFNGGKAQRPVGMWSIKTKPVPQMLSALQTYTLGWFSQMASDWKIGFRDMPGDFSPTQRQGSRKAFVYGLAAQATLAGALGLPGVGQGLSLLKQATGLDLKGELRATLASLFEEDQENGGMLTNLALRGGLAGVSPIDPSNRAAISFPFVGVDPYKGFDLSALFGATGTTVSDAVKGTLALAKGDFQGFQKLLPSVIKSPLQLLLGEGDIRDARGGLLQKLTPAERFWTSLGIPPSRVQASRDTSEAVKNLNEQAQRDRERLVDDLATTYRKQGPTLGQQKLVAHLQDHPTEDGAALIRAIASRVRRQVLPYDYRRDLNVAVDLKGLGSRMKGQELEGQKLEYEVQKNLGLRPKLNMKRDLRAISVDQLMDSDPYLTRAAAIRMVEQSQPTRRRSNASLFQAPQLQFQ